MTDETPEQGGLNHIGDELTTPGSTPQPTPGSDIRSAEDDSSEEDPLLGELLDDLPPETRTQVAIAISRTHLGPLPDAQTMREYKEVDPRILDEVLEAASANRKHRYKMDLMLASSARTSLILSAALVALAICASVFLAVLGHPVVGGLLGAGGLGAIIFALIRGGGKWTGKDDRDSKSQRS